MPNARSLFPCMEHGTYLNSATYGPGPQSTLDAVSASLEAWGRGHGDWLDWEQRGEDARRLFAQLLNTRPELISLLPTVSMAAAQVATSLPRPAAGRPRIVVGEGEFRSNCFPWLAQERHGFEVVPLPFPDGRPDVDALTQLVDERTALIAISTVQSANGFLFPLDKLYARARETGARVFLDASQSVGALDLDLAPADYVTVSGYKWLFAPRGTAFLSVRSDRLEEMHPVAPNWKSSPDPFANFYGPPYELADEASRLDQSLPWHSWVGAAESLRLLNEIGVRAIHDHSLALARKFRTGVTELGLSVPYGEEEGSQIVGLPVPNADSLQQNLVQRGITAAVRNGNLRVSFALFNDESDVETVLDALRTEIGA